MVILGVWSGDKGRLCGPLAMEESVILEIMQLDGQDALGILHLFSGGKGALANSAASAVLVISQNNNQTVASRFVLSKKDSSLLLNYYN